MCSFAPLAFQARPPICQSQDIPVRTDSRHKVMKLTVNLIAILSFALAVSAGSSLSAQSSEPNVSGHTGVGRAEAKNAPFASIPALPQVRFETIDANSDGRITFVELLRIDGPVLSPRRGD